MKTYFLPPKKNQARISIFLKYTPSCKTW